MYCKHDSMMKCVFFLSGSGRTIRFLLTAFSIFFLAFLANPAGAGAVELSLNPAGPVPWNWLDLDGMAGDVPPVYDGGTERLTLESNGADVWTGDDEYGAYYLNNVSGDFDVEVTIVSQEDTNDWAKAGIMVKNDMTAAGSSAGYCMVALTPENNVVFQWDGNGDGNLDSSYGSSHSSTRVRLKKQGQTFTAYRYSTYLGGWSMISYTTISSANAEQDVGLFVSSHASGSRCTVVFEDFIADRDLIPGTQYTITASPTSSTLGAIYPSGAVLVPEGQNRTFLVDPNEGYEVDTVLVDSVAATLSGNEYIFSDVQADHTIAVTFKQATNDITVTAGSNGSVSPSGTVEVTWGAEQTFNITPNLGYQVSTVKVDGVNVTLSGNQYTFSNVTTAHTLEVTFAAVTPVITAEAGSHGTISPAGSVSVVFGQNQSFTITPDSGYLIYGVWVDGTKVSTPTGEYVFENVTTNHTIEVTFTDELTYEDSEIPGCATGVESDYSSGFEADDFNLENIAVVDGDMVLQTGQQGINPDSIVIPFKQEVFVTFLYEGAGYVSDFGYVLKQDAVNADGSFKGWGNIPADKKHPVFVRILDDVEQGEYSCCGGGNGILDTDYGPGGFPTTNEAALSTYDDGTGIPFIVDGDGVVTPRDMKKSLGTFDAGTELVFFLTADKRWTDTNSSNVFFTKTDWNPDTYTTHPELPASGDSHWVDEANGIFDKVYLLDQAIPTESWSVEQGWLAQPALGRLSTEFNVTLSGTSTLRITKGAKYSHVIVGAPADDPNQWILGWEDLTGGGDTDHNDLAFRIERKTGGVAQLQSAEAIRPTNLEDYYTAVTLEVYDKMPCSGKTNITYYVSVDDGDNWVEITDWDEVYTIACGSKILGDEVSNWVPGTPECTYRSVRVDFAARGLCGNELIWKAYLESKDEACIPEIEDVRLTGSVASHGSFTRASPVVQANVIYSGSYETPAVNWVDKTVMRGHLKAARLYDPTDPTVTDAVDLWDAGAVLSAKPINGRHIYFPSITTSQVIGEQIGTGGEGEVTFTGTLAHHPAVATTIEMTDQRETFRDEHTKVLKGDFGGTGTINRFTGAFEIHFNQAPEDGVPIVASYSYYNPIDTGMTSFEAANVSNANLGLDDSEIVGEGYVYDLDNDGDFDENDGDWLVDWVRGYNDGSSRSQRKEWLLGPIDHSVPAVLTPPGRPAWYYGTAITPDERGQYDIFRDANKFRRSVVFVGSRDGMLHAFDGGKFRWGDNPATGDIEENRGYFLWEMLDGVTQPNYGTGEELWAFIPANLVPRLKNNLLSGDDQSYVDASPALADVFTNGAWRTVLLSAEGNGGDTVFCLDVTNPDVPLFVWEFADPDLFRSRSSPAVAQIGRIVVSGTTKWVAFFVSGKTNDPSLYPSIYLIDIADGSVIERVYLNAEPGGVGGVPSGQPAIVDSDGNGFIDRMYIGTDKGYLYKVNIPDDPTTVGYSISHCVVNTDFDYVDAEGTLQSVPLNQQYHPIYSSPTVVVDNEYGAGGEILYRIRILFGTGDSPYYDEDINFSGEGAVRYHFFAYVDQDQKGLCNFSPTGGVNLSWFYELPAGHRIFASAFAAAGQVYFGTSTAETEDPCQMTGEGSNDGAIFVFNIEEGVLVKRMDVGNVTTSPLVEDEHLYVKSTSGLKSYGGNEYNNEKKAGGIGQVSIGSWKEVD